MTEVYAAGDSVNPIASAYVTEERFTSLFAEWRDTSKELSDKDVIIDDELPKVSEKHSGLILRASNDTVYVGCKKSSNEVRHIVDDSVVESEFFVDDTIKFLNFEKILENTEFESVRDYIEKTVANPDAQEYILELLS
jgi:hypothetical protein